jgi:hypothetical protein
MRHCVRRKWREWEIIGAIGQAVQRHGVRVKLKKGVRPHPFNHGIFMHDTTHAQLELELVPLPRTSSN